MSKISKFVCETTGGVVQKPDYVMYQATCTCLQDHQMIEIEVDKDGYIATTFYYRCIVSSYWHSYWRRIKTALRVLFCDYVDVECDFLMNEDGLRDYIKALQEGLDKLQSGKNS